jgi:hydrogenase maturation protein HypF
LLDSPERPIVLVPRRPESGPASEVAPSNPFVGLFLAYTPLHHLVLAEASRPLVMTSGNLSEEPMAYRDAEAVERLGGVADLFLTHDREIETRCDDSVACLIAGRPVVLRRSRGYVPRAVVARRSFSKPVLACGAQLKNTFCLASADAAWLGPHIGDLENLETLEAFAATIERMERFLSIRPEVIAHDLHPDYLSTRYASSRPESLKLPVQHHHAHVVSAMAENGLEGPVLGVAYDGTGYGTDGTAWGGELLLARHADFERLATLRPVRLAGGETAIREVWRVTLALLDDAFEGAPPREALDSLRAIPSDRIDVVRTMIARRLNSPLAHGVGRLFDAVGGLVLRRERASYEGQVALEWNLAADAAETRRYGFAIDEGASPWELDVRPMVRELVADLAVGESAAALSGRFHNTLAIATAELLRAARRRVGRLPVVLSGGCFQNALLTEKLLGELQPDFEVYLHGEVPPGDGGIALGQAVVADAVLRGGG